MNPQPKTPWRTFAWLAIVLAAGLVARFWFGTFGHNYDFDSYRIVADILGQGQNVYAHTDRYNYGPVWFNIIHILDALAGHNPNVFRWLLVGLLSAVDVGIFYLLWRKFGRLPATIFFLNPVSIMITGYHNQFDNLAILLGLLAVQMFGDDFEKPMDRRKFSGLIILGFSLMTKHLLFAFPFWLAVKQRGLFQKLVVMAVPTAVFLAGFAPYWSAGHAGIVQNVFEYRSATSSCFYNFFMPAGTALFLDSQQVWLIALVLFAFICRKQDIWRSLLLYTCVLVATSPALTNQYLAIPAAFVAVELNLFSICYLAFAAAHIAMFANGPHLTQKPARFDDIAVMFLFLALVWTLWRQPVLRLLQICRREIKLQFGRED